MSEQERLSDAERQAFLDRLKKLDVPGDPHENHEEGDRILCEVLRKLGHADIVEAWEKIFKWYS